MLFSQILNSSFYRRQSESASTLVAMEWKIEFVPRGGSGRIGMLCIWSTDPTYGILMNEAGRQRA